MSRGQDVLYLLPRPGITDSLPWPDAILVTSLKIKHTNIAGINPVAEYYCTISVKGKIIYLVLLDLSFDN